MSISSSIRLLPTKIPLPLHPKFPFSKSQILSKPSFFSSSIFIQTLPTTTTKISSSSSTSSTSATSASSQSYSDLPPKLQEIISLFQSVQDSKAKYQQLLFYGKNLKPLDTKFKTEENKVQGCVSQVWVRAYVDSDKNILFEADSDSAFVKGLAALLVQGLSCRPVSEILAVKPDFVTSLGLNQGVSRSRNNGFLNMLSLMQKKALEVYKEAEEAGGEVGNGGLEVGDVKGEEVNGSGKMEQGIGDLDLVVSGKEGSLELDAGLEVQVEELNGSVNSEVSVGNSDLDVSADEESSKVDTGLGSRGERIREKLERELSPSELEVEDISYQHAGHTGVRGSDGETHFNVRVVAKEFEGKSMVKRHRLVYDLLKEELQSGLHALSIVAKTPSEVSAK